MNKQAQTICDSIRNCFETNDYVGCLTQWTETLQTLDMPLIKDVHSQCVGIILQIVIASGKESFDNTDLGLDLQGLAQLRLFMKLMKRANAKSAT